MPELEPDCLGKSGRAQGGWVGEGHGASGTPNYLVKICGAVSSSQ